METLNIFKKI